MSIEVLNAWEEKVLKIESLTKQIKELQIKLGEKELLISRKDLELNRKVYIEDIAYLSMSGDTIFFKDEAEAKISEYLKELEDGD